MRPVLKTLGWISAALVLLVSIAGIAVMVAGNSDAGRRWIEQLTYRLTSGTVRLSGLAGSFPTRLTLHELELVDGQGVWLSAQEISLTWSPLRLLEHRIRVDTLQATRVHMERVPVSDGKGGKASVPYIDVAQFSLPRVELGAPLVGTAASLSLQGGLVLRSLEDATAELAAHRLNGEGDYTLHLRFDSKRMDASLSLNEPAGGPLEHLLSLPGLGALSVSATLRGPRTAELLDVALDAGGSIGKVHGSIDWTHTSADLDYSLIAPATAPRPDLRWDALSLDGNWHGPLAAPTIEARLQVDNLKLPGSTGAARVSARVQASRGKATLHGTVAGLQIPGPQPRFFSRDAVEVDADLLLAYASRPLTVTLRHPLLSLQGKTATTDWKDGRWTVDADVKMPELAPFAVFTTQDVRGSAAVKTRVSHDAAATALTLNGTVDVSGGTASWLPYAGPRVALTVAGNLTDSRVIVDDLKVAGRAVSFAGSGSADRTAPGNGGASPSAGSGLASFVKSLQTQWQLDVSDLAAISGDTSGTLKASGRLSGAVNAMTLEATASSHLSVRGSPSGEVSAAIRATGLPRSPSGSLLAHGTLDGSPLNLDVGVERANANSVRVQVRHAEWKSAHVDGDLTVEASLTQSHGQLGVHVANLGDFDRLVGSDLTGSAEGTVGFVPVAGHTQAQLRLDVTGLNAGRLAGDVHLEASGVPEDLAVQLNARLPNLNGSPASLTSTSQLNIESRQLRLTAAALGYRGQTLKLQSPALVSFANGVSVDELKLGVGDALIDVKGAFAPALDLQASVQRVHPALVNAFAPGLLASGNIEARARLQGAAADPTGQVSVDATGLRFADDAATGLPPAELHAHADLGSGFADLEARLEAGPQSQLTASGRLPLDATGAMDLKFGGKVDMTLANPYLEARGMRATGELVADATVTGPFTAPQVGGGFTLSRGSVRDYGRGVNLTDITAEVVGNQGALQIKSFKATAASGTVGVTGSLGLLQPGLPLDLAITAQNAQPIASSIVTANLDADIHVKGTLQRRLDVTGKIHVNRATVGIPNSLPPDVAVLDVRRRGRSKQSANDQPLVIGMDLTIAAPQEVLVQGRGLDAEMGGEIHLTGTSDAPLASGAFYLQRGSFTLSGNKLTFDQGSNVSFAGAGLSKKIDPTLDFTARTTIGDTTAILNITGVADAPKFEFTSSPVLQQDDIMARLLFGEPGSQLSALQLAQVGYALASLSGVGGGGTNPLVKLQKSLGLDRLSVGTNTTTTATGTENSGAAIQAGRYISKRVYIEGKQSTQGTSQVQVDVDLTKHLKLQTRLGNGTATTQGTTPDNDPGSSVGLSYQFEY